MTTTMTKTQQANNQADPNYIYNYGDFVRRMRKGLGVTQAHLGQMVGATGQTICNIENGRYNPSEALRSRLNNVIGPAKIAKTKKWLQDLADEDAADSDLNVVINVNDVTDATSFRKANVQVKGKDVRISDPRRYPMSTVMQAASVVEQLQDREDDGLLYAVIEMLQDILSGKAHDDFVALHIHDVLDA